MAVDIPNEAKQDLRTAFDRGRLALYLGAGVSVPSGLPTWQRLVMTMYFEMLRQSDRRAYGNYLHAVAEWMLTKAPEPLEITAQKIRIHYGTDTGSFVASMKRQLYAGFEEDGRFHVPARAKLRRANPTLRAVATLCERSSVRLGRGVEAVITYNYADLLEISLNKALRHHVVDSAKVTREKSLPIYHVHGYVPMRPTEQGTSADDIIFTEERYHEATNVAYSWSNLVQLRGLSSSTGLMVGLSLSDRNLRRLLHALRNSPVAAKCYAVLQRPTWQQPHDHEAYEISQLAQRLYDQAQRSGSPLPPDFGIKGENWEYEVTHILARAHDVSASKHDQVLRDFGVTPIWYDDHSEAPGLLEEILG